MLTNPGGLWLLTLWLPLTLILSRSQRYPLHRVSNLWLWSSPTAQKPRALPWRLPPREAWPWYVAILFFALGAAEPNPVPTPVVARHVAFVIDTSASMSTQEHGGTRLDLAKARIATWLDRSLPGTRVMLVPSHFPAAAPSRFESDPDTLRRSLHQLQPTALHTRLQNAVTVAVSRLKAAPGSGDVVIVTDGMLADASPLFVDAVAHEVWQVGSPKANMAVVRASVSPLSTRASAPQEVVVSAVVKNFDHVAHETSLSLRHHNATSDLDHRRVKLEPERETAVELRFTAFAADAGTGLVLQLQTNDALRLDDSVHLVVPRVQLRKVVLPTAPALSWLERALKADPDVEIIYDRGSDEAPQDALVVLLNHCPTFEPKNDFVVLAPPAGACLSLEVGPEVKRPTFTKWDESDVRFQYVNPSEQRVTRARAIRGQKLRPLLEAREGVLAAHVGDGDRIGTVLGFGLDDTDWPSRPSFVMFVRNLVHHSRSVQSPSWSPGKGSGDFALALPSGAETLWVRFPDGDRRELRASDAQSALAEYGQAGFYHLTWTGHTAGSGLLGISVADAAESDPRLVVPQVIVGGDLSDRRGWAPRLLGAALSVCGLLSMSIPLTRLLRLRAGTA